MILCCEYFTVHNEKLYGKWYNGISFGVIHVTKQSVSFCCSEVLKCTEEEKLRDSTKCIPEYLRLLFIWTSSKSLQIHNKLINGSFLHLNTCH